MHRPVGGDGGDFEFIDLLELGGFRLGGTGHAGELLVHAEVVLESDGGERLIFALDLDAFLRFDGLVQAIAPAAARHHAAGELVDDDDLVVLHQVILVTMEHHVGLQRLLRRGGSSPCWPDRRGCRAVEQPFHFRHAFLGERHGAVLFFHCVVAGGPLLARLLAFDHFAANQASG